MSSRSLRRAREAQDKGTRAAEADEDFQPLYAQEESKFRYDGLQVSSGSEEEPEDPAPVSSEEEPAPEPVRPKKNNKKKKNQRKAQKAGTVSPDEGEIERLVKEVNEMMGTPPPVPSTAAQAPQPEPGAHVMQVQLKNLMVINELKKKFGPDDEMIKKVTRHAEVRMQKKTFIVPPSDHVASFQKNGLSMSVYYREGGCVYFTFDHSPEYRRRHQRMLVASATGRVPDTSVNEAARHMHVEAMLEAVDMMFRMDEHTSANTLLEMGIAYMQYVAHPAFHLTDPRTRLSYAVVENRAFHVLVLKYLYMLSNRACHRTALELAKMLLNLDPTDPLAVLLVIDTLALRARQHQWLVDAVDHWASEREAGFLFNIKFSYAMANFHVAKKADPCDLSHADGLLQDAILRFPSVPLKLLEFASLQPSARVQACALFAGADDRVSRRLKSLVVLYGKLTCAKWREPAVLEWLQRNLDAVAEKYDADPAVKEEAKKLSNEQLNLFQSWPQEVIRHLCIIKPMANLLVEGAVPHVSSLISSDPVPPRSGVNRYNYSLDAPPAPAQGGIRDLFSSLMPNYAPDLQ